MNSVVANTPKGDPKTIIEHIDSYCKKSWMMNLGEEKAEIVKAVLLKYQPKNILELGTYSGYSSLTLAHYSKAVVHSIEPEPIFVEVARTIHDHAGMKDRIFIHQGTIQSEIEAIKKEGPFDMVFIDHEKSLYLPDFKFIESAGLIRKGTVVVGDNMIRPGSPDYLQHFKESKDYDSILYRSFLEYTDIPDAVLVSERLSE